MHRSREFLLNLRLFKMLELRSPLLLTVEKLLRKEKFAEKPNLMTVAPVTRRHTVKFQMPRELRETRKEMEEMHAVAQLSD